MLEDLRQKCLFKHLANTTVWFDYLERVHSVCRNNIDKYCSEQAHKHLGLDWHQTENCVVESFSKSDWESTTCRNSIIDSEIKLWKEQGTNVYPSVQVNGKTYRG